MFEVEHELLLPMGLIDADGTLHREGVMRLATAADEILPLQDPRVQRNPAYLSLILLSRVVLRIGAIETINPRVMEGLFAADLAYLQDRYNAINRIGAGDPERVCCPHCERDFDLEPDRLGGSSAIPSPA
jgi:hypothetical protein